MKNYQFSNLKFVSIVALLGATKVVAMPMFSTQTGMDCTGCHTQQMPKLNKFGRKFVASGMTLSQAINSSQTTHLEMYPSLLVKMKYEKTDQKPTRSGKIKDKDTNQGEWSIPRTTSIYLGGKITDNIGSLIRASYRKEDGSSISGKVIYAYEIEDGYIGASLYSFSNFGPFSGIELYNTGLYKPIRTFESRKYVNATQACEIGTGAVTGLQTYYDKDMLFNDYDHFFITVGIYTPDQHSRYFNLSDNIIPFGRIAYEYEIGDFNLIVGAFAINGGKTTTYNNPLHIKRETYGFDLQIEGELYEKSISIIATNIVKNKVAYTGIGANTIKDLTDIENEAFSIETEIMATEQLGIKLSYLELNDLQQYKHISYINVQDIDSAITLGVDYSFNLQIPMKFSIEHTWVTPSDNKIKDYRDLLFTLTMAF